MGADSDQAKLLIAKLNSSNYQLWKLKMKVLLMRDGLWDVVNQVKPEPTPQGWHQRESKAIAAICLTVEDDQLLHLTELETAREMWQTLQRLHERSSIGSRLYLKRKLYGMRFTHGTMQSHLNAILEIVAQLRGMGKNIEDDDLVAVMLCSLPDSYSALITALEGKDEADLSVEYVSGKLLDEYQRRVESGRGENAGSEIALKSTARNEYGQAKPIKGARGRSIRPEDRECYFCRKRGHIKVNCRKYKRLLEKGDRAEHMVSDRKRRSEAHNVNAVADAMHHLSFAAYERASMASNAQWYVDSGATSHMTNDKEFFTSLRPAKTTVYLADSKPAESEGIGEGWLFCITPSDTIEKILLKEVLYVPSLESGLLSVQRMTSRGCTVTFKKDTCLISWKSNVIAVAAMDGALFKLKHQLRTETAFTVKKKACIHTWHRRLGHRDLAAIRKLSNEQLADGIHLAKCDGEIDCEVCIKGKLAQLPFPTSESRATKPTELVHSDVCGPMPTATPSGHRYMLTFIDDYSRFTFVRLLKAKDEVADVVKEYVAKVKTKFGHNPVTFRTDNGKEYVNWELQDFFKRNGIEHQFSAPYTPQQNGVAERKNRALVEMAKCMLIDAKLPERFWGEAVCTAAYLQNRLPSRKLSKTPFEIWTGKRPSLNHIRIFGSKAYSLVPQQKRKKWDDRAIRGTLVGYDNATKGYRLLDPMSNRIWISRSVRIIEEDQQYATSIEQEAKTSEGAKELTLEEEIDESGDPSKHGADVNVEDVFGSSSHEVPLESGMDAPRRSQRANKGVPPQKLSYKVKTEKVSEPSSWEEVLVLPPCERDKWIAAAKEELASLKNREVWELVQLPAGREVISSKWVFKLKKSADDTMGTYKARLVARGFSQRYGEDYDETFAPVVKHETIRMLLSIAAIRSLHVRHFDVKCAYLNGEIDEELYMQQPPGFEEPGNENLVLRLKRSIYGLKQSARAWNKKATETLLKLGFDRAKADLCLYVRKESTGSTTYVLLYVDDLLVAGESEAITRKVGAQLNKHFITKDLGKVSNYLGIQIERKEDGTFLLHQRSKVEQLLEKLGMSEVKPMGTPMETGYLSAVNESSVPLPNNVKYRQVIGSLLYIATVSRPDIALAVGLLCRRVESPTEYDWKCAKRALRYLAGTKELKLCLSAVSNPVLQGYVDADWAGDKTDRKSTSAYSFQFGESIISWSTKKQTTVALSSTEAEYIAMAEACKELLWLRQLLEDFGIPQMNATTIYEDNQGCICLVESDRFGDRTKHISVKYHLLKDLRERGIIDVKYCPSDQMMADALTKPVSKEQLRRFVRQIGLVSWQ